VLLVPPGEALRGTAVKEYIDWGEAQGFHHRNTCRARDPWYSLPPQPLAPLVLPKGIWHRHLSPLLDAELVVDQQLYRLRPVPHVSVLAAAALFNSAWFALQVELQGRVNFGKGLLWLATYELEEVRLPDPRRLSTAQISSLEQAFLDLADRPFVNGMLDLEQPQRKALDQAVFDTLHFTEKERTTVIESLQERLTSRQQRAQNVVQ
jgi:hypothetical protein